MHSDFIKEIELMKRVEEKNNSHVVSMICCSTIQEPKALVLEYVEYGDLLQYLQKNKLFVSLIHTLIFLFCYTCTMHVYLYIHLLSRMRS